MNRKGNSVVLDGHFSYIERKYNNHGRWRKRLGLLWLIGLFFLPLKVKVTILPEITTVSCNSTLNKCTRFACPAGHSASDEPDDGLPTPEVGSPDSAFATNRVTALTTIGRNSICNVESELDTATDEQETAIAVPIK